MVRTLKSLKGAQMVEKYVSVVKDLGKSIL